MSLPARHILLAGRVQGVGFRWSTRAAAEQLGVAGWVRNLADQRVEVWIEGMQRWLAQGPSHARVDVQYGVRTKTAAYLIHRGVQPRGG